MRQFWAGRQCSSSGGGLGLCSHDNVRCSALTPLLLTHPCQHSHGLSCRSWAQAVLPRRGAGGQRAVLDDRSRRTSRLWRIFHVPFCSYREKGRTQAVNYTAHKLQAPLLVSSLSTVAMSHLDRQSSSVGWSLDSPCGPTAAASNEPPHSATEILHSGGPENTFMSDLQRYRASNTRAIINLNQEVGRNSFFLM